MRNNRIPVIISVMIFLLALSVRSYSWVTIDLTGGYGFQSAYEYLNTQNNPFTNWLEFNNINLPFGALKVGINLFSSNFTLGFYTGFFKRFDLVSVTRGDANSAGSGTGAGTVFCIPFIGYIENDVGPFFYEIGCGPMMNRINYDDGVIQETLNVAVFGFLFGAGYKLPLTKDFQLLGLAEFLVSTPNNWLDLMPESIQSKYYDSRHGDLTFYSDVKIVYHFSISIGIRYLLGESIKLF